MAATHRGGTGPFAVKSTEALVADTHTEGATLKRSVGALDLTALGVGAVIGTGIFVVIGQGVGEAGPAVILAFVLAGITCFFSALSYAELASSIPVSGSAYTYAYATLGEIIAWIIGWDLILEYGVAVAAVAVGWARTSTPSWTRRSASRSRRASPPRPRTAASSTSRPS